MAALEEVSSELTASDHPSWDLVYRLLRLTLRLYGFGYAGTRCYSLAYWQTPDQRLTEELFEGGYSRLQNGRADAVSLQLTVRIDLLIGRRFIPEEIHECSVIADGKFQFPEWRKMDWKDIVNGNNNSGFWAITEK